MLSLFVLVGPTEVTVNSDVLESRDIRITVNSSVIRNQERSLYKVSKSEVFFEGRKRCSVGGNVHSRVWF